MATSKRKRDAAPPAPASQDSEQSQGFGDHLLERMTDGFLALDRDWRVVYMNSAAMGLNAKPRPDVIGRIHWEEWPHTAGSEVERQYRLAMETQRSVHFEHHYNTPGLDFWHLIHAYPDARGLSIFYRDITEQKRAEHLAQLLATAGSRFVATLDQHATLRIVAEMALPLLGQWSCVYLVDEAFRVTDVGMSSMDDRLGTLLRQVVAQLPVSATDARLPWNRAMQTGEPVLSAEPDDEFFAALRDESLKDFVRALAPQSLLCVPLIARGRTIGGITFGTAKGRRRHDQGDALAAQEVAVPSALALDSARLFEAERRARREAEDANKSKLEFLRAMSHELRTPLNAIGGYAQLMLMGARGDLEEQQERDLHRILRNHDRLTSLINDVMSFVRLDAGRVEFDLKRVPVDSLLQELEGLVAPDVAFGGGHQLSVRRAGADVAVWADAAKTTQILVNLMSNAIKHTPRGTSIEVCCESADGDAHARICVRDTGPGIAQENLQSIFEPFVQVGRELHRPIDGLGLGLAIARDLARRMNGDLTVESQLGAGASFVLTLPRR